MLTLEQASGVDLRFHGLRLFGLGVSTPKAEGDEEMAPSTLAQWFGALGTIAAVVVALFKDSILAWRRKPRLDATCTKQSPWTARVPYTVSHNGQVLWTGESYWVRAKVENSGQSRAKKVQVYAGGLARLGVDGKFVDIPTFLPLNMRWANSPPGGQGATLDGISPRMGAFCDIVAICNPANPYWPRPEGTPANTTVGQLQLEAFTGAEMLPPGTYRLSLRIAAANVEPIEKIFTFRHTGTWLQDDAEMRRACLDVSLK